MNYLGSKTLLPTEARRKLLTINRSQIIENITRSNWSPLTMQANFTNSMNLASRTNPANPYLYDLQRDEFRIKSKPPWQPLTSPIETRPPWHWKICWVSFLPPTDLPLRQVPMLQVSCYCSTDSEAQRCLFPLVLLLSLRSFRYDL